MNGGRAKAVWVVVMAVSVVMTAGQLQQSSPLPPTLEARVAAAAASKRAQIKPARVQQQFSKDWVVGPKRSIAMNNMACSPTLIAHGFTVVNTTKAFCKVCGGTPAVTAACLKDKRCVAFVVDENDSSCGVLKSSAAKTEQFKDESKSVFCYTPRAPTCTGRFAYRPGLGMPFSGDFNCYYEVSKVVQPFCFAPGGLIASAKACINDERCLAFSYQSDQASPGAVLKGVAGVARPQAGSDLYWRL